MQNNNSDRFQLSKEDLVLMAKNILMFEGPALIVAFTALQSGQDFKVAIALFAQSTYTLIIDLLRKFSADNSK